MTHILLRPSLRYDPETGIAEYCKQDGWHVLRATDQSGYIHASIGNNEKGNQIKRGLHQIVYAHFHGEAPPGMQIDHIDCDKTNNKLSNLRCVDRKTNCRNRKPGDTPSGFPGIYWGSCNKWVSKVSGMGNGTAGAQNESHDARKLYAWYYAKKGEMHGLDSLRHLPAPKPLSSIGVAKTTRPTICRYMVRKNHKGGFDVFLRKDAKLAYISHHKTKEMAELAVHELSLRLQHEP